MGKCVVLCRVSTQSQDLKQQEDILVSEAERLGYSDIITISDKESAICRDFEEREGISKLIETIDEGGVERVIVYEISRIARRADVFYKVRDILVKNKIQLQVMTPGFLLLNEDGTINENSNLLIGLFLSMAENEMMVKKARFARGKAKAKAEGRFAGGKVLFGYCVDKEKHFHVNEEEAAVVRRIYEMYLSGKYSARKISSLLYAEGVITQTARSRETWTTKILKNKAYCGTDIYEPLVTADEWSRAQELLAQYQVKPRNTYADNVYYCHKVLFVEGSERQMMVRKPDCAYIEPDSGYCLNINVMDSLLLHCAQWSVDQHRADDIERLMDAARKKLAQCEKRLANYRDQEKKEEEKLDRLEERIVMGTISAEKGEALERKIREGIKKLAASRRSDEELKIALERETDATRGELSGETDVYSLGDEERKSLIADEIEKAWVGRVKNGHYTVKVKYRNPLMDGEIYHVYTKAHKVELYGERVDYRYLRRFERRKR